MPFKSKAQARVCYSSRRKGWDCDEWARKTPSLCCLPEKSGGVPKCRTQRKGEPIKGPVKTGPKGGRYFTLTEKDKKGKVICTWKVYLKR